jgi:uncharacterized protein YdeI (YjbR/CyaY-like superfamily)
VKPVLPIRKNPDVDWYFSKATKWQREFQLLRELVLTAQAGTGAAKARMKKAKSNANGDARELLQEELKWGHPCYTLRGGNVVLMHGFKEYCALLFHKGALITDSQSLLVQQSANVQSARQLRFTGLDQVTAQATVVRDYVNQAVAVEASGARVERKTVAEFAMPEELAAELAKSATFKRAFYALTPGRQRGYLLYFGSAKQSATRASRIAKDKLRILQGLGRDD